MKPLINRTNLAREIIKRKDIMDFIGSTSPLIEIFNLPSNLPSDRIELYKKNYFGIGNTKYYKTNLPNDNKLYIKMEYANSLGNTHYSRYWLIYIFLCESLGIITPGKTIILEVTSGSSGIALANVANIFNYDTTIIVPNILPQNRIKPMQNHHTTIIKVDGYILECILKLRELNKDNQYFATNHSEEKFSTIVKIFKRIGFEIVNDNLNPDVIFLGIGNGTSTLAISKVIKDNLPNTKIVAYCPDNIKNGHNIVYGLRPPDVEFKHYKPSLEFIDIIEKIDEVDLNPIRSMYKYDTEINNLGDSSLYGLHYAYQMAKNNSGKKFIILGYDKADRY